ncbi:MAG: diguanylate cyclase [Gammaproteobacteria bacterium]
MNTINGQHTDQARLLRLDRQQQALFNIDLLWRHYAGNLDHVIRKITEIAARALDIERTSVWQYDAARRSIVCSDLFQASADNHTSGKELNAGQYPAYFDALEAEEAITAENALSNQATHEFAETYLKPLGIGAMLDAPIRAGGKLAGVLCHEHVGGNRKFHADEINTAVYLANLLGAVFEFHLRVEEKQKIEELLRDEAALWNILFDESRDAIVVLNHDGSVYKANKRFVDMLGYTMEEILNLHVWDWDYLYSEEQIQEMLNSVDTLGAQFETRHRCKDGTIIDVELSNNGSDYQGRKLIFCICRNITERRQYEQQLEQDRLVIENSNTVLFRWRAEEGWPVDLVSENVRQFGYDPQDLRDGVVAYASMIHPDDLERVASEVQTYNDAGASSFEQEYRIICTDGRVRWIYDRSTVERDADGRAHHFQGIVIDISERKEAEEKLRQHEELLHRMASQVPGILYQYRMAPDGTRTMPYISEGAIAVGGIPLDELYQGPDTITSAILPEDAEKVEASILESARTMQPWKEEFRIRHRDGSIRWLGGSSVPTQEPDGSILWYGMLMDITEHKLSEEKIHQLAITDELTGIFNRREFTRLLQNEVERVQRYGTSLALIMYDLDHFKQINDTHGHDKGDDVLRTVVGLVNQNIRSVDSHGRWGGEEFMIMLPQSGWAAARQVADKIRQAIEQHHFDEIETVTASFGVAELESREAIDALFKRVDDALYQAKQRGRNRVEMVSKQ